MLNLLYDIIIYPIVQIIEIAYVFVYKVFDDSGLAVLGVSFAISILCLPLYIVAEKWQQIERKTQKRLKPKIDKIKAVFKGDEQYLILSTFYRQNHYRPVYTLRSTFGLLIQIPFFIAAYSYLSHLEAIQNTRFLFIANLGAPDSLFHIGSFPVNVLPIAMTLINCIAGTIYTKGFPLKEKIQIYGMAAVFLVLLYNSPSGLVLYWTMNNIFSLAKNIFYKLKNPGKVLRILVTTFLIIAIGYLVFLHTGSIKKRLFVSAFCLVALLIPFCVPPLKYALRSFFKDFFQDTVKCTSVFILSCLILVVVTGLYIPSTVIASSPDEFSFIDSYDSPISFILVAFSRLTGLFVFLPACVYFLMNKKIKAVVSVLFCILAFSAVTNTFLFSGNYGAISNTFHFNSMNALVPAAKIVIANIFALLLIIGFTIFINTIHRAALTSCCTIVLAALGVFSTYQIVQINMSYRELCELKKTTQADIHTLNPIFSLSKDKQNIIIIMSDGAINGLVKPIFEEHPKLQNQFDGWTLYPNTLSFATHTLLAAPPLWGGYEYTPKEMNKRADVPLVQKHNEALLLLPRLFTQEGFHVTVTDPSWANYSWISDISIYQDYDTIDAMNTIGRYTNLWYIKNNFGDGTLSSKEIRRNIVWFSLLKIAPVFIRGEIYDDSNYWGTNKIGDDALSGFLDSYSVLDFLPELTTYNSETSSALFITNEATHDSIFLEPPDYIPGENATNHGTGTFSEVRRYHSNSAFYLRVGSWLDQLKEAGVYDNTRIIIVSDHGAGNRTESYNPVLLVKDFNAHGELKTDMTFMTNADVPLIAADGIINDPVNPFTKKPLSANKDDGVDITINHIFLARNHGKYVFKIEPSQWVHVHDNIFESADWEKILDN